MEKTGPTLSEAEIESHYFGIYDRAIADSLSTAPMTEADRDACRTAIRVLYRVADMPCPSDDKIIFVASPFDMMITARAAEYVWHARAVDDILRKEYSTPIDPYVTFQDHQATLRAIDTGDVRPLSLFDIYMIRSSLEKPNLSLRNLLQTVNEPLARLWNSINVKSFNMPHEAMLNTKMYKVYKGLQKHHAEFVQFKSRCFQSKFHHEIASALHHVRNNSDFSRMGFRLPDSLRRQALINLTLIRNRDTFSFSTLNGDFWNVEHACVRCFRDLWPDACDFTAFDAAQVLANCAGPCVLHSEFCVISDRPEIFTVDEIGRLHNTTGPAIQWRDGAAFFAIHGTMVPHWVAEQHEKITLATIRDEPNVELRRIMIEQIGWDEFLRQADPVIIDHDERWGTLMRINMGRNEDPISVVVVTNRSPEPDGSYRKYILPVHHQLRPLPDLQQDPLGQLGGRQKLTVHNGIASTFGLYGKDYYPEVET